MPEQRRRKAIAALATVPAPAVAQANRDRASRHLASVAAAVASRHGYPDLGSYVTARIGQGASLAAISREAGLNKDWLSRHLACVDPVAAQAAQRHRPQRLDARWRPALTRLGFPDVASYLRERHLVQHQTVNAIATETGLTHHTVAAALRRHGPARTAHAAKRHQAGQRAAQVAAGFGFDSAPGSVWQKLRLVRGRGLRLPPQPRQRLGALARHRAPGPACRPAAGDVLGHAGPLRRGPASRGERPAARAAAAIAWAGKQRRPEQR